MNLDTRAQLKNLKSLLEDGLIDIDDFNARRKSLLDLMAPGSSASPKSSSPTGSLGSSNAPSASSENTGTDLDLTGTLIGPQQRYRIDKSLGKGTFGEVYLAEDMHTSQQLGRSTWRAIKVLNPRFAQDQLSQQRLTLEATQVMELSHENIVKVHDWSFDPQSNSPFLVMEALQGQTLNTLLAERLKTAQPAYSLQEALNLLRPVAQALDYAWRTKKLVHRDLKPDNLFITEDGTIKILDFGLAARIRSTGSQIGIAMAENAGALGYAPPEAGAKQKEYSPRMDVYSLGVLLYQLLDNELDLPYGNAHTPLSHAPEAPEQLSEEQWQVLQQALLYNAADRPKSAGEFIRLIEEAPEQARKEKEAQAEVAPFSRTLSN